MLKHEEFKAKYIRHKEAPFDRIVKYETDQRVKQLTVNLLLFRIQDFSIFAGEIDLLDPPWCLICPEPISKILMLS